MLQIRIADSGDYSDIRDFQYSLIDTMEGAEYKPEWETISGTCIFDQVY